MAAVWKYVMCFHILLQRDAFLSSKQAEICKDRDLRQNLDSGKLKYPGKERSCILIQTDTQAPNMQ